MKTIFRLNPKTNIYKEEQLHTENIQDFKLVENRIDEIIKGAKNDIAILFCNSYTLKINETQSILKFLKENKKYYVRILLPEDVDDRIIQSFGQIANVTAFR